MHNDTGNTELRVCSWSPLQPPVLSDIAGVTGPIGDLAAAGTTIHQFTVTDQDDVISCSVDPPENSKFAINTIDGAAGTQRKCICINEKMNKLQLYTVFFSCSVELFITENV